MYTSTEEVGTRIVDRKQRFYWATEQLLCHAKLYSQDECDDLVSSGHYNYLLGGTPFFGSINEGPRNYLVPSDIEREYICKTDCIFDSQVSPMTIRDALLKTAIHRDDQDLPFAIPFKTAEDKQLYLDTVYELISYHFERVYDALVPLYQIECESGIELPLANTVLHAGGEGSLLADHVEQVRNHRPDSYGEQIRNRSFLKFRVTGDRDSRLAQVDLEVEMALQVLRFVYPWPRIDNRPQNFAQGVSMWKSCLRQIVYLGASGGESKPICDLTVPNQIFGNRRISRELLRYVTAYCGLVDINYHFKHFENYPISQRIVRSLRFYDSAKSRFSSRVRKLCDQCRHHSACNAG